MVVAVVNVRVVRVRVSHRQVVVRVAVWFARRVVGTVCVLVVFVVDVTVVVRHRLVFVFMIVPLGQVQPNSDTHESRSQKEDRRGLVTEQGQRDHRPDEGSDREVRSCSRRAEISQC